MFSLTSVEGQGHPFKVCSQGKQRDLGAGKNLVSLQRFSGPPRPLLGEVQDTSAQRQDVVWICFICCACYFSKDRSL